MDLSDFAKEHPSLPSDSEESDDDDYAPSGAESSSDDGSDAQAALSEEEASSEAEGEPAGGKRTRSRRPRAATKRRKKSASGRGKSTGKLAQAVSDGSPATEEGSSMHMTEEEQKKKADALWQDFKSSTGEARPSGELTNGKEQPAGPSTVTVTQVYQFAGEEVSVQKEVAADSAQARLGSGRGTAGRGQGTAGRGRGGLKGLSSVLGQLGRKPKIGTLEKSRMDWDRFKQQEGIEDDIRTFNRGKDGFLERQDFLQRTDVRQFEIERGLRATRRSNR